ncbi:MAG TPA: hypothetical protein VHW24_10895 [Bryobacteraceae bacterium]|jgi:hypothetical protein|nr:hypothetical protein [Bryobacteraceae bacterium]
MPELRKQREATEEALLALEKVFGAGDKATTVTPSSPAVKKTAAQAKPARKGGITPAGRKRLAERMKQIWAAKRAAGQTKRSSSKKA